jgi:WD40 repeat protein
MRFAALIALVSCAASLPLGAEEARPVLAIPEPDSMVVERVPFKVESVLTGLAWSPDGRWIASCEKGTDLVLWWAESGLRFKTWNTGRKMARAVAWSPTGEFVVAAFDGEAVAWDAKTGEEKVRIPHSEVVAALAFIPGTAKLVSGGEFGELKLTDLAGKDGPELLPAPCKWIRSLAITQDGRQLAIGGHEPPAAVVDLSSREIIQRIPEDYTGTATWVGWSVKKDRLFVRFDKSPVCEYDTASGEKGRIYDRFWIDTPAAFDTVPGSDDIVACFESGYVFRCPARRISPDWSRDLKGPGTPLIAVSPTGSSVALRWSVDEFVIADASTGDVRIGGEGETPKRPKFVAWSPDGKSILATRGGSEVHVFEAATGKRLRGYVAPGNRLLGLAPREDGAILAATFGAAWIRVTDLTNGQDLVRETLKGPPSFAWLSEDGSTFTWWQDGVLRVRDLVTLQELPSIRVIPEGSGNSYASLSPHGDVLIQFGADQKQVVYADTTTGTTLSEMKYGDSIFPVAGVLSPDGALTALVDQYNNVDICFSGQKYPVRFNTSDSTPSALRFSPDGRWLALLSKTLTIIDVRKPGSIQERVLPSKGSALAWSPNGRFVATIHADGITRVWEVPQPASPEQALPRDPILDWGDLACQRTDRAHEAAARLELGGPRTVALFREKLAEKENQAHIRDLISQLGFDTFEQRQAAREELHWLGVQAEPELNRALIGTVPGPWRTELETLLRMAESRVGPSSQNLRRQRAMHVLEAIGSTDSIDVLRHLSNESPSPRERMDAQDAIRRIEMKAGR